MDSSITFWNQNEFRQCCPGIWNKLNTSINLIPKGEKVYDDAKDNVLEITSLTLEKDFLFSRSVANFADLKAAIVAGAEVTDTENGRMLATVYTDCYETKTMISDIIKNVEGLVPNDHKLKADVHFLWCDLEGNIEKCSRTFEITGMPLTELIDKTEITEPRAKNKIETVILYNRMPVSGEMEDYRYPNNGNINNKVRLQLPVNGFVQINPAWEAEEILYEEEETGCSTEMKIYLSEGGVVTYAGDYKELFKIEGNNDKITFQTARKADVQDQRIRYEDSDSWSAEVDVSRFSVKTIVTFSLKIKVRLKNRLVPSLKHDIYITVNSKEKEIGASSLIIEPIALRWGCIRKGSRVLLADGSERLIETLYIGEGIMGADGSRQIIRDIYRGMEEELVNITLDNGGDIRVTSSHPILTPQGCKAAGQLNGSDSVIVFENFMQSTCKITGLFVVKERVEVYNLDFDTPTMFICNGFCVGDFYQQNNLECKQMEMSKEARVVQQELKNFIEHMNMKN